MECHDACSKDRAFIATLECYFHHLPPFDHPPNAFDFYMCLDSLHGGDE